MALLVFLMIAADVMVCRRNAAVSQSVQAVQFARACAGVPDTRDIDCYTLEARRPCPGRFTAGDSIQFLSFPRRIRPAMIECG